MPEYSWQRVFPGEESQLAVMRKWLAGLLPAGSLSDDLAVVATELGTNAIRHTASCAGGGQFIVEVTWHPAAVRVAVTDCGAPAGPRIINDPLSEQGRGLRLVQGMSALMGVTGSPGGRQVWADVPRDQAVTAEPVPPPAADEAIQAGLADLTSRFAGIPVWFGQTTQQWWALTRGQLLTAPSVPGLAELLSQEPLSARRRQELAPIQLTSWSWVIPYFAPHVMTWSRSTGSGSARMASSASSRNPALCKTSITCCRETSMANHQVPAWRGGLRKPLLPPAARPAYPPRPHLDRGAIPPA